MHYQTKADLIFAILFVVLCVSFACSINAYEKWSCNNYEGVTGNDTKYIDWDKCYVKRDGVWDEL